MNPTQEKVSSTKETFARKIDSLGLFRGAGDQKDAYLAYFKDAYQDLEQEYVAATPEEKQTILRNRFFDTFFEQKKIPGQEDSHSLFTQKYSLCIPQIPPDVYRAQGVDLQTNHSFITNTPENGFSETAAFQYGSSRLMNVDPSDIVQIRELGEEDVLGSLSFTMCTALVARTKNGTYLSHVTSSNTDALQKIILKLRAEDLDAKIHLFWPKQDIENSGITELYEERKKDADSWNKWILKIAEDNIGIQMTPFPYYYNNKQGFNNVGILVAKGGIQVVEYMAEPLFGVDRNRPRRERYTARVVSIKDVVF